MKITYDVQKYKKGQWRGVVAHHNRVGEHQRPDSQVRKELWLTAEPMHVLRKTNYEMLEAADAMPGRTSANGVTTRKDAVVMIGVHFQLGHSDLWRSKDGQPLPSSKRPNLSGLAKQALKVAEDIYGKERVAGAVLHCDETAPHVEVYVVPLRDGKLNAKSFVDGPSTLSNQWQQVYEGYKQAGFDVEKPDSGAGLGGAAHDGLEGNAGLLRTVSALAQVQVLKYQLKKAKEEPKKLTALVVKHREISAKAQLENLDLKSEVRRKTNENTLLSTRIHTAFTEGYNSVVGMLNAANDNVKAALAKVKALEAQLEKVQRERQADFDSGRKYERELAVANRSMPAGPSDDDGPSRS